MGLENNENDPKSKVGDHVKIPKYKNFFAKDYTPNWSKELLMIKNLTKWLTKLCHGHMLFSP